MLNVRLTLTSHGRHFSVTGVTGSLSYIYMAELAWRCRAAGLEAPYVTSSYIHLIKAAILRNTNVSSLLFSILI